MQTYEAMEQERFAIRHAQIAKVHEGAEHLLSQGRLYVAFLLYTDAYERCQKRLELLGDGNPMANNTVISEKIEVRALMHGIEERVRAILLKEPRLIGGVTYPQLLATGTTEETYKKSMLNPHKLLEAFTR